MNARILFQRVAILALAAAVFVWTAQRAHAATGVEIKEDAGVVKVRINGQPFTEYHFKDVPRPYFYPLLGPGGLAMTRNWPMQSPPNEQHDHPHYRSLWFAHGLVNGHDFWSEDKDFGK